MAETPDLVTDSSYSLTGVQYVNACFIRFNITF